MTMSLQTPHRSKHVTVGSHEQEALFSRASSMSRHISARARIKPRGGERVSIDAASTAVKLFFNGASRRRSQANIL